MHRADAQRGITLLEILVVLAILALLAGGLTFGYSRLPETALKREAVKIAAALRSAYDRAIATGAHHRIVLDLTEGSFFVERCEGKVQLRKSRDLAEEQDKEKLAAEKAAQLAQTQTSDQLVGSLTAAAAEKIGETAKCEPVKGESGKKHMLGGVPKVTFNRVHAAHLEDPARAGKVTLNFFPLGTAERAVIVLSVDDEHFFSLAVHPLSGRIEMFKGEWRDVEAVVREDAEGKEVK